MQDTTNAAAPEQTAEAPTIANPWQPSYADQDVSRISEEARTAIAILPPEYFLDVAILTPDQRRALASYARRAQALREEASMSGIVSQVWLITQAHGGERHRYTLQLAEGGDELTLTRDQDAQGRGYVRVDTDSECYLYARYVHLLPGDTSNVDPYTLLSQVKARPEQIVTYIPGPWLVDVALQAEQAAEDWRNRALLDVMHYYASHFDLRPEPDSDLPL